MEISQLPNWYVGAVSLVFGALWGSFANVCIARIPEGLSIAWPPSRCPLCLNAIRPRDNIPVLSWLMLGARCRDCRSPISARYPIVELMVALLSMALALRCPDFSSYLVFFLMVLMLVVLTFIDLDHWLLPDVITIPGMAAGLALSFLGVSTPAGTSTAPLDSLIGLVAGYGSLYAVALLFRLATGKVGMGKGDLKLLAMIGSFLGYQSILPVIFLSALQGSIIGITLLLFRRGEPSEAARLDDASDADDDFVPTKSHIPYGPFISLAAMEYLFFGPAIFDLVRIYAAI